MRKIALKTLFWAIWDTNELTAFIKVSKQNTISYVKFSKKIESFFAYSRVAYTIFPHTFSRKWDLRQDRREEMCHFRLGYEEIKYRKTIFTLSSLFDTLITFRFVKSVMKREKRLHLAYLQIMVRKIKLILTRRPYSWGPIFENLLKYVLCSLKGETLQP